MKSSKNPKRSGTQWKFGTKPTAWVGLLNLANGLIQSTADEHGRVIVDARWSEMLQRDLKELGEKLHAVALGASAAEVFGQETDRKPGQQQQQLNYAVDFWRARAEGHSAGAAARIAKSHYPGFESPSEKTIERYARDRRDQVFAILEHEGMDLTNLRNIAAARASRGNW